MKLQTITMDSFDPKQWEACYAFYEQIYQECYPYRELPSRKFFLKHPAPFTTVTAAQKGFALCADKEWLGCCHYKVNAEQKILTCEVKFKQAAFYPQSAAAIVNALLAIARSQQVEVLQMVAETAAVRDYFIGTREFQKVGQVRESVMDINELDAAQQAQWQDVIGNFQLKEIDWDDANAADAAVTLHNEGMQDVPIEGVVGANLREDRAYFMEFGDKLRACDRELLTFGLYDGASLAGLALFECRREQPMTFMIHYTGIARPYRRRELGKGFKAWTVAQLRRDYPGLRYVVTGNHETNVPMLRINIAMGFRVRSEFTMLRYQGKI